MSQLRETAMRVAFSDAVYRVLQSPVVKQPRLVARVARKIDQGVGMYRPMRGR
jgi:hypothetical protein